MGIRIDEIVLLSQWNKGLCAIVIPQNIGHFSIEVHSSCLPIHIMPDNRQLSRDVLTCKWWNAIHVVFVVVFLGISGN